MADKEFLPFTLDKVIDAYGAGTIKEITQNHRGTTIRKSVIGGTDQAMPKSHNWTTFLSEFFLKGETSF